MRIDWKKLLMAFVAVYIVGQALNYAIHGVWLQPTYESLGSIWRPHAERESKMWVMFATSAVFSFLFCYVFARGYEGRGLAEGARYGAVIGLFFVPSQVYETYVIFPIPVSLAHAWFVSGLAYCVVLGLIAAAIYKPARAA